MNKKWFTLVELIVVIIILAILWTISFIALQWYSQDARDTKRITDIRNLITKLTIEHTKWVPYFDLINWMEDKWWKINTWLTILWQKNQTSYQWPINFENLREDRNLFLDPTINEDYIFAWAEWWEWENKYSFLQWVAISEKNGDNIVVWNYYQTTEEDEKWIIFWEDWRVLVNWKQEGTSQCKTGKHYNEQNSQCEDNKIIVNCSWNIPSNWNWITSDTYEKIWNWIEYMPTDKERTNWASICWFVCINNYVWQNCEIAPWPVVLNGLSSYFWRDSIISWTWITNAYWSWENWVLYWFSENVAFGEEWLCLDGVNDAIAIGYVNNNFSNWQTLVIRSKVIDNWKSLQEFFWNWEDWGGWISYYLGSKSFGYSAYKTEVSARISVGALGIDLNKYHTFIGTFDDDYVKLYIDGILQDQKPFNWTYKIPVNNTTMAIWANPSSFYFNNYVNMCFEYALVYERSLTQEEVEQIREADFWRYWEN
jgi:type II secretory pathway pseudopilin PulG